MLTFMFLVNMLGAMLLLPALGAWLLPKPKAVYPNNPLSLLIIPVGYCME